MKRRCFIKKAIAGLAFVGMYLKSSFLKANEAITLEEQNLQKQFGVKSDEEKVSDILFNTVKKGKTTFDELGHWHHFVATTNLKGYGKSKVYVDGKLVTGVVFNKDTDFFPGSFQVKIINGNEMIERLWFRNKDNG